MRQSQKYYIQGMGNISPQRTFDDHTFLDEITAYHKNVLTCLTPEFKNYINPVQLRRMSRMFKIGLTAAKISTQDAALDMPDAIITASGYGCIGDTSKFLLEIINNEEKQLTPTYFMQSTYNSISGGIAMAMKCNNYNTTYVHRGFAFETALQDAMMQIEDAPAKRILVGGFDETDASQFAISTRTGYHRRDFIDSLSLFQTGGHGTLQGEGAAFFVLGGDKTDNTYAMVSALQMIYAPKDKSELTITIQNIVSENNLAITDIDIVINGIGGDTTADRLNKEVMSELFTATQQVVFKHLTGDYCTASAFSLWLAANILRHQSIPEPVKANHLHQDTPIRNILMLNHFRGKNYSVMLVSGTISQGNTH
jgi:3-oxoacyl-[acyl-carrier-protein] synthase II